MQQPGMYGYAQPHFIPGEILINGTCVSFSILASFSLPRALIPPASLYISLTIHSQTDMRVCFGGVHQNSMPGWNPLNMWNPTDYHDDPDCRLAPMYNEVMISAT